MGAATALLSDQSRKQEAAIIWSLGGDCCAYFKHVACDFVSFWLNLAIWPMFKKQTKTNKQTNKQTREEGKMQKKEDKRQSTFDRILQEMHTHWKESENDPLFRMDVIRYLLDATYRRMIWGVPQTWLNQQKEAQCPYFIVFFCHLDDLFMKRPIISLQDGNNVMEQQWPSEFRSLLQRHLNASLPAYRLTFVFYFNGPLSICTLDTRSSLLNDKTKTIENSMYFSKFKENERLAMMCTQLWTRSKPKRPVFKMMDTKKITESDLNLTPYRRCSSMGCEASESADVRFKKCGGCHSRCYCSASCQKQDWCTGGHKKECDGKFL
jgi:hypothetical protein